MKTKKKWFLMEKVAPRAETGTFGLFLISHFMFFYFYE